MTKMYTLKTITQDAKQTSNVLETISFNTGTLSRYSIVKKQAKALAIFRKLSNIKLPYNLFSKVFNFGLKKYIINNATL